MADISKLLGAGGGGGGGGLMAAMGRMGGLGGMGGMSGLMGGGMGGGGMTPGYRPPVPGQMPGMAPGGMGGAGEPPDPRMQNLTPEEFFKPGGELAYRMGGGMQALNPSQQYRAEQRLGGSAPAGFNFAAMAPYFTAQQGGQQPGQPPQSPLRGMFRR
jgi:hypothetical protein